jgi:hypothetical protein
VRSWPLEVLYARGVQGCPLRRTRGCGGGAPAQDDDHDADVAEMVVGAGRRGSVVATTLAGRRERAGWSSCWGRGGMRGRSRRRRWAIYYESFYRGSRGVYRGPCEYERRTWHAHFSYVACPIAVRRMPGWAYGACPFPGLVSTGFSTASRDLPTGASSPWLGNTPHAQFGPPGSVLDLGPRVRPAREMGMRRTASPGNGHAAYDFECPPAAAASPRLNSAGSSNWARGVCDRVRPYTSHAPVAGPSSHPYTPAHTF